MSNQVPSSQHLMRSTQRVLSWTRVALALHAAIFNILRLNDVQRPGWLLAITVLILAWSLLLANLAGAPQRWQPVLLALDVSIALLIVLSSRWVVGTEGANAFPPASVYWQVAAALAVAVTFGGWLGLAAGAVIGLAGVVQTPLTHMHFWSAIFITCLAAWGIGQLVDTLRKTTAERDRSLAATMALAERDRMNRIVHDGALQVLSMVEREGRTMGPRGQRLAQLARQQEIQLRTVLQDRTVEVADDDPGERRVDVSAMLDAMSTDRVTVSRMAGSVVMPAAVALEIRAAVAQVLLNSELHAGADAQVWVLLEEGDGEMMISVRDNGVGMTREQVQRAVDAGRLGIRESIIGRIHELGGTAEVRSSPGRGVEWELTIPYTADDGEDADAIHWPDPGNLTTPTAMNEEATT
ncbi:sensor histidine kinase [Propionibacteriaceae bacterium Y1923]